ncbi:hypothetical protein Glove_606g51 [Diversispora epigaea]|uniref:Uncharacterized protein n=1 Tax=Diversispora epigaea TaxID=1348612 RepID=A0A397G9P2_9GLOM|nr:hypothetical protein Glove_606g51 [Diversispora epigaea]
MHQNKFASGDIVYEEYGLAHDDKIIDTRSEWCTFSKFHGKEEIESICHSMDLLRRPNNYTEDPMRKNLEGK